jgi:hypothetical protein
MCNTKSNQYWIKREQFQEFITELKCDDGIKVYKHKIKKTLEFCVVLLLFICESGNITEPLFPEPLKVLGEFNGHQS